MDSPVESASSSPAPSAHQQGRPRAYAPPAIAPALPVLRPVAPEMPANEFDRLNALHRLGLLDTPPDEGFDRLARLAADHFRVPICMVSLVDEDRVWFKSHLGLGAPQMQRKDSFCGHAILTDQPLVVRDASRDPRFRGNPLVIGKPGLHFYAGQSLRSASGARVGALSLLDYVPREFDRADLANLATLAGLVSGKLQEVEARDAQRRLVDELLLVKRESPVDPMTGLGNRRSLLDTLARERIRALRRHTAIAVVLVDIDQLRVHNELHGDAAGDLIVKETARRLRGCLRPYDHFGRLAGDTFMAICPEIGMDEAGRVVERLRGAVARKAYAIESTDVTVSAGVGAASCDFAIVKFSTQTIIDAAERALAEAKKRGTGRFQIEEMKMLS
jgi:diguanylate cyclase (GGDEF)-like protein